MEHTDQTNFLDPANFDALFIRHHQFLCMVAMKIVRDESVAKDVVQDFFVKFWLQRNHNAPKNFEAYAYRSVKNSCINYLKHQTVENKHLMISMEDQEAVDFTSEDELPSREKRLSTVLQLLNELPAERRKIFELHVIEGLTYQQIADRLVISINTVKTQLRRAYGSLRGKAFIGVLISHLSNFL